MESSDHVKKVCDEIVRRFAPEKIILFNLKKDITGGARSFKICVVLETEDKMEVERHIYLDIDSDIPFDVLIYTPEEWKQLGRQKESFAFRIYEKGQYIYGDRE
ncbi:MAG TPA: hypothetical protein VHR42_05020 [Clostridia bacterium]|nr:hypothetical protein [Clostridia bacterium]